PFLPLQDSGTVWPPRYCCDSSLNDLLRQAHRVTTRPMTPAAPSTRPMPRPWPTPYHPPIQATPLPVVMNGMKKNCAMGPIRKAVSGAADNSTLWANPMTRPSRSVGTTFCNTVCSHASTNGTTLIQINSDVASSQIEGCSVMTMQTIQQTMFTLKIRFTGFLPK